MRQVTQANTKKAQNFITTLCGHKLELVKVYGENEKFYGKIAVRHEGLRILSRFDVNYFNSIVADNHKILIK